jgi:hypothetical protein
MASLHEYFVRDARDLTTQQSFTITVDGSAIGEIIAKLHFDFNANAKYISFYIPAFDEVTCPEALALQKLPEILMWPETQVGVTLSRGSEHIQGSSLVFTGRVYLYSERPISDELKRTLEAQAQTQGHSLMFRSVEYVSERNSYEKPRAFISHDSRDKVTIAEPLAAGLQNLRCPVWFDKFSLKVGDSLKESIETGLRECSKCIFILTPNFLSNGGWSKREYESIFTRELVEKQKVILPVWHSVSVTDVYNYSPILADRFAVEWSLGVEEVARRLLSAIS